jgi:hypothetical protein
MIPKCHPCHLHPQEALELKAIPTMMHQKAWSLCPKQEDLRVARCRRSEKTSKNYKECVNAIAEAYDNELTLNNPEKRLAKGYLEQLILQKKEEFGISCNVSVETVRSRIKRGSLAPTHPGSAPPLLKAELASVEICIQMGKIRQPLTRDKAIAIMNDMISKTEMSASLTEFQKVRTSNSQNYGLVGRNWWHGFKKRHATQTGQSC